MITAGLRRGELAGLQWRDVDFDNLTVSIERNAIYTPASGIIINTPKTENSARVIPLLPKVAALLKAYKEQHFQPNDSLCFVFHGKGGNPTTASDSIRTQEYTAVICMADRSVTALPELEPPI